MGFEPDVSRLEALNSIIQATLELYIVNKLNEYDIINPYLNFEL